MFGILGRVRRRGLPLLGVSAVLLCAGGYFTLAAGRKTLATVHAVPEETVTTLKENSEWIAKRLSSVRK